MSGRRAAWRCFAAAALVTLLVSASGCYRTALVFDRQGRSRPYPTVEAVRTFALGAIELGGPIQLDGLCPDGVARIEQQEGFLGVVVRSISQVISLREVEIYCVDGNYARGVIDADGNVHEASMTLVAR